MSTTTSIAMQSATEAAATKAVVTRINDIDLNLKAFCKFNRTVVNVVRAVSSSVGGGDNEHIYLLESVAAYTTQTVGTGYREAFQPGAIDFTDATTSAQISRVKETCATDPKTYNTQEGVRVGLHKIIVANVPAKILVEIKDAESGLDKVEPRTLLETIKRRATPVTCLDPKALKTAHDAPLTFDTSDSLTTQFTLIKKAITDLQRIHSVATSESEMMMAWFLQIEKEKDIEDQVVEF